MLQSIKKRTSNKKLFCYSISSPINRSFGALSILRDKKERVKLNLTSSVSSVAVSNRDCVGVQTILCPIGLR